MFKTLGMVVAGIALFVSTNLVLLSSPVAVPMAHEESASLRAGVWKACIIPKYCKACVSHTGCVPIITPFPQCIPNLIGIGHPGCSGDLWAKVCSVVCYTSSCTNSSADCGLYWNTGCGGVYPKCTAVPCFATASSCGSNCP